MYDFIEKSYTRITYSNSQKIGKNVLDVNKTADINTLIFQE